MQLLVFILIISCLISPLSKAGDACVNLFDNAIAIGILGSLEKLQVSKTEVEDMVMEEEFMNYQGGFGALGMWRDGILAVSISKTSLYRGMILTEAELNSILAEGMLISKTRGFNQLHFGNAQTALNYSLAKLPYNGRKLMVIFEVETVGLGFRPHTRIITKLDTDLPPEAIVSIFILDRDAQRDLPFRHLQRRPLN